MLKPSVELWGSAQLGDNSVSLSLNESPPLSQISISADLVIKDSLTNEMVQNMFSVFH